jgi:CheY-like chemotaxis protein
MTPPEVAEQFRHAADPTDRKRQLVLAVEDEHEDWLIYGKLLWYNGFEVIHAETGEEGLALAREHQPDVILADLMLPGMDGIQMCRKLRTEGATREIPVVVLTARTEREFGSRARQAGCAVFLEKPVGPVAVLHVIEDLVGRPPPPVD